MINNCQLLRQTCMVRTKVPVLSNPELTALHRYLISVQLWAVFQRPVVAVQLRQLSVHLCYLVLFLWTTPACACINMASKTSPTAGSAWPHDVIPRHSVVGGSCHKYHFVPTEVLSWQAYFCHDKHVSVMTKHVFCHDRSFVVASVLLSWQKSFVATNTCLLQRKWYLWQLSPVIPLKVLATFSL